MDSGLKLAGGVTVACAACCAVTIVPALFAGTSVLAIGGATAFWGVAALAFAVPMGALVAFSRRKAIPDGPTRHEQAETGCGCHTADGGGNEAPIACTLDAGDFTERASQIRDLARRSLRRASRTPLSLTLTYAPEAADEVRTLVARERECCPFLTFGVTQTSGGIEVAIVAPPSAAEPAEALFDHFAPEFATAILKETA